MADAGTVWTETYKKLPPDAQQRIQAWLGTQMFIARELGLEREEWFQYVEWALTHPFDFSFLGQDGINLLAATQDAVVNSGADKARATVMGGQSKASGGALTNPAKADDKSAKKAGLANIHTLSSMLDEKKKKK